MKPQIPSNDLLPIMKRTRDGGNPLYWPYNEASSTTFSDDCDLDSGTIQPSLTIIKNEFHVHTNELYQAAPIFPVEFKNFSQPIESPFNSSSSKDIEPFEDALSPIGNEHSSQISRKEDILFIDGDYVYKDPELLSGPFRHMQSSFAEESYAMEENGAELPTLVKSESVELPTLVKSEAVELPTLVKSESVELPTLVKSESVNSPIISNNSGSPDLPPSSCPPPSGMKTRSFASVLKRQSIEKPGIRIPHAKRTSSLPQLSIAAKAKEQPRLRQRHSVPTVTLKESRTPPEQGAKFWSERNKKIGVKDEEDAEPDYKLKYKPLKRDLENSSAIMLNYLISDYEVVGEYLESGTSLKSIKKEASKSIDEDDDDEDDNVDDHNITNDNDSYSDKCPDRVGVETSRRKVGDQIHWIPKSVGDVYGLGEYFSIKHHEIKELLQQNRSSCFGKLNMRKLRAWDRGDGSVKKDRRKSIGF